LALAAVLSAPLHAQAASEEEPQAQVTSNDEVGASVPEAMPGAEPFGQALREQLAARLEGLGPGYAPRSHNLDAEGRPDFTNRLVLESSPYLAQHAHNPVDWHPWGDEAFDKAKRLDRPVLVSIGYSTCHWCHVMEEESFDDPALAAYLNAHFVAIKVDREVRPDVDAIYMAAVHALGVQGGWPLNVFLTPDRKPFYGGTYFPPQSMGGRPSFRQLLEAITREFESNRDNLENQAREIAAHIRKNLEGHRAQTSAYLSADVLRTVAVHYVEASDPEWGGLNHTPKFPSSLPVRFLLRYARRSGHEGARDVASLALEKMATGGMHDQLGGGFHRYSTDRQWLVPHFEKMLYDNALLATDYLEAWQATGRDDFRAVCVKTLDYVAREMTSDEGAFYSATDADSLNPKGEREEGWFFTWTPAELDALLDRKVAKSVATFYGVSKRGNFEGRNIFTNWRDEADVARELGISVDTLREHLAIAHERLYAERSTRPAPLLDDKVLVSWNGLMISAFARAGFAFGNDGLVNRARNAARLLLDELVEGERLLRVYKDGVSTGPAFLEDHAFFIRGLIDLYEATGEVGWLEAAIRLQGQLDDRYRDSDGGGYYKTASDGEALIAREKPGHDGAIPSGNSIAAHNLARLHTHTHDARYRLALDQLLAAFDPMLRGGSTAAAELYQTVDFELDTPKEIVVVAKTRGAELDAMLAPLRSAFLPNRTLSIVVEDEEKARGDLERHAALAPLTRGKHTRDGRVTAYVCEDRVCKLPTSDPAEFASQFAKIEPYPSSDR
jgi:hypothetical protein